jgi:hypothetical protein
VRVARRSDLGEINRRGEIAITPDGTVIRNAVIEGAPPERYDLGELRAALETWIAAIERARSHA